MFNNRIAIASVGLWALVSAASPAVAGQRIMLVCQTEGRNGHWMHIRDHQDYAECRRDLLDHNRRHGHNATCTIRDANNPESMRGILFS